MSDSLLKYYQQRAAEYEGIYDKPERQANLMELRKLLRLVLDGHRVLELACGTGYWTEVIAETAEFILATDANKSVLDIAREKQLSPSKVSFIEADAYALDGLPRNFTALLSAFWWSHLPRQNIRKFLDSIHSFLPQGSLIVFIDNLYVEGSSTPISENDGFGNTYQIRKLSNGSSHRVLKNFHSKKELLEATNVRFDETTVTELDYFWFLKGKTKAA